MVTGRRLLLSFALGCLLCSLAPQHASGSADGQNDEIAETFFSGGRHLQQYQQPCNISWQYVSNFTIIEDACPYVNNVTDSYPKKQCCNGLAEVLCPYQAQVNEENSVCAKSFWATLALVAPNYTDNFFSFICTDPNSANGIECPNDSLSSPGSQENNFSPGQRPYSFGVTLLLAIAILEILILLF